MCDYTVQAREQDDERGERGTKAREVWRELKRMLGMKSTDGQIKSARFVASTIIVGMTNNLDIRRIFG